MTTQLNETYYATVETEKQLLGAILIDASTVTRESINKVALILSPEDFANQFHQRVYSAMLTCGSAPHYISVAKELDRTNKLAEGDVSALIMLVAENYCTHLDIEHYANLVKEYSNERQGKVISRIKGAE